MLCGVKRNVDCKLPYVVFENIKHAHIKDFIKSLNII